jgi:ribose 5-phosphate isomerase B
MKIALSSDEYCELVDVIQLECQKRGHVVFYYGPRKGEASADWPVVTAEAAQKVQSGEADEAIVLCYTGTGASIAANKLRGIRAALCIDPETAKGARIWNHANVLALSIRLITPDRAREILDAWFNTEKSADEWNLRQLAHLAELEDR